MSDRLEVRGLQIHGHHGVLDFERRDGQVFVVDLVLEIDAAAAAVDDRLDHTVDYAALVADVEHAVANDPVNLIETLAERVAEVCLSRDLVAAAEVTVHKPSAPIEATFADVAVTIKRSRT